MKASIRLLQRTPLIKFVGGPHLIPKNFSSAPKSHPQAPNGLLPSLVKNSKIANAASNLYFSRADLPLRFRYKPIKEEEIENVLSGGAILTY